MDQGAVQGSDFEETHGSIQNSDSDTAGPVDAAVAIHDMSDGFELGQVLP